jgi:hypothetical protein
MSGELDEQLLTAVRAQFEALRTVEPAVISKLLGTRTIAPWYKEYKERRALEQQLPDHMADAGLTPEMWAWATGVKSNRAKARKAHADEVKQLATAYKQKVDIADGRRDAALGETNSDLMDLIEAGFDQLPLAAQAIVSAATDDRQRKDLLDKALLRYRSTILTKLYPEGPEKFAPGKGPAGAQ